MISLQFAGSISAPLLEVQAGSDTFVNNAASYKFISLLPTSSTIPSIPYTASPSPSPVSSPSPASSPASSPSQNLPLQSTGASTPSSTSVSTPLSMSVASRLLVLAGAYHELLFEAPVYLAPLLREIFAFLEEGENGANSNVQKDREGGGNNVDKTGGSAAMSSNTTYTDDDVDTIIVATETELHSTAEEL